MHGRLHSESPEESRLWRRLMTDWNHDQIALSRDLAVQYTQSFPDNVWGWVVLADILASLACFAEARSALRRADALAPESLSAEIGVQWGHFYLQKRAVARATAWYRKAVDSQPKATWLVYLGASLSQQGKFSEAKRSFRRAIKQGGPGGEEAYYNLGLIHRAEGKYAGALSCFDRAIELAPKYALAKRARADVLTAIKSGMNRTTTS